MLLTKPTPTIPVQLSQLYFPFKCSQSCHLRECGVAPHALSGCILHVGKYPRVLKENTVLFFCFTKLEPHRVS